MCRERFKDFLRRLLFCVRIWCIRPLRCARIYPPNQWVGELEWLIIIEDGIDDEPEERSVATNLPHDDVEGLYGDADARCVVTLVKCEHKCLAFLIVKRLYHICLVKSVLVTEEPIKWRDVEYEAVEDAHIYSSHPLVNSLRACARGIIVAISGVVIRPV